MDMAPRWSDGYGVQSRIEYFNSESTTWLEGVYTFDKSVRVTFKLPHSNGDFGGLILGLPLKKYRNDGAKTSNWSITPSLQLPSGNDADWDPGLSLSYSSESPKVYQLYDLYRWEDRVGLDINVGLAFPGKGSGMFALWDISALTSDKGDRIQTGPVFVYFKKNMMLRAEYKALVYEHNSDWSGGQFSVGVGFVY
jgi:hypothetical protein|tara:strand:+ start:465 stop:1049 length:585 start_codon:yes stop_codon:yes gene_type:complete